MEFIFEFHFFVTTRFFLFFSRLTAHPSPASHRSSLAAVGTCGRAPPAPCTSSTPRCCCTSCCPVRMQRTRSRRSLKQKQKKGDQETKTKSLKTKKQTKSVEFPMMWGGQARGGWEGGHNAPAGVVYRWVLVLK